MPVSATSTRFSKDTDFDSLRPRDDFKKLLQRLESPPRPAPSSGGTGETSGHVGGRSSGDK